MHKIDIVSTFFCGCWCSFLLSNSFFSYEIQCRKTRMACEHQIHSTENKCAGKMLLVTKLKLFRYARERALPNSCVPRSNVRIKLNINNHFSRKRNSRILFFSFQRSSAHNTYNNNNNNINTRELCSSTRLLCCCGCRSDYQLLLLLLLFLLRLSSYLVFISCLKILLSYDMHRAHVLYIRLRAHSSSSKPK